MTKGAFFWNVQQQIQSGFALKAKERLALRH